MKDVTFIKILLIIAILTMCLFTAMIIDELKTVETIITISQK